MIRSRVWRDGQLVTSGFPLSQLSEELSDDQTLTWVDLLSPSEDELTLLAEELGFDPHWVEDAVAPAERPKVSRRTTHTFVTVYSTALPDDPDDELVVARVSAFILPHGLVTVRISEKFDIDAVVERWDENPDLVGLGVPALLHGLLDVVVDGHFAAIAAMDDRLEEIEDRLFDGGDPIEVQRETYSMRKDLVQLRRVVLPTREVVDSLFRQGRVHAPELVGFYEDLYDHVLRAAEWTESLRDLVTSLFETSLSLQDARLNTVMKKLAGWAAIIAVPTAITGWFGQNIPYPGFGAPLGLVLAAILVVVCPVVLYLWFKKVDWV